MDAAAQYLMSEMTHQGRVAFPTGTPIRVIQVMGERASGTNFLRSIVQRNLEVRFTNELGWKHGFPHMAAIPSDCLILCSVRNPVDWALAMHKRPWHAHPDMQALNWEDFLRAPWRSFVDKPEHFGNPPANLETTGQDLQHDRHPITGEVFANLFKLRTAKLQAMLGMRNRNCAVAYLQMEHVTDNARDCVDWLSDQFDLKISQKELRVPGRRLGNRFLRVVDKKPKTPKQMSADDLAFVRSQIDIVTESLFGYAEPPT